MIRTAIIGFGTGGRVFHAPLIAAEGRYDVTAIVTRDPERAAAATAQYPGAAVVDSVEDVFARDDVDLLVVTSPNETHLPLARRAVAAGIAVVVDKPIGTTAREALEVVEEAEAAGVPLTVFHNRRWDGDFMSVRDAIAAGAVGEVHQFESAFEWFSPTLTQRWKDVATPAQGGGILFDLGPHLIDQALQLFGDVDHMHAELDARRPGAAADDDAFVTLTHTTGVRSRLWMSAIAPANRPRFRVVGSEGVLTTHGLDPQEPQSIAGMRPLDEGFGRHPDARRMHRAGPDGETHLDLAAGNHLAFYRALADALLNGAEVPVNPRDAVRSLELIEQLHDSTHHHSQR